MILPHHSAIKAIGATHYVNDHRVNKMNYDLEEMEAFFKGFSKLDKEGQEQIIEIKEDFDNIVDNSRRVCYEAITEKNKYKKQSERYLMFAFIVAVVSLFNLFK